MNDDLGTRMKERYENRTRISLPRRTYSIIRVDGKAFHTFTRGFARPYDKDLMGIMDRTAIAMCMQIQGAQFAYVQSDEISILLTDFATIKTDAWFDGNVQKITSISAAMATAAFNKEFLNLKSKDMSCMSYGGMHQLLENIQLAHFDSRVFTIPDPVEVHNYFVWRQQDATRNSIQMAAQSLFSHKELHGKHTNKLQEMMLTKKDVNWNNYTTGEKRGRIITKEVYQIGGVPGQEGYANRSRWVALDGSTKEKEIPVFTQDVEFLKNLIPRIEF